VEDEKIVAWFLESGDQAAFSLLVERYQKRVFRLVCSVLGPFSEGSAEEVCQEVFLKVYKKIRLFSGRSSFRTWLYRLTYNMALDWRRRNGVRITGVSVGDTGAKDDEGYVCDPLENLLSQERRLLVVQAIERLPELCRTIIYMHYWLDSPVEAVAEELGLPEGTVKSYLFRARQSLRKIIERKFGQVAVNGGKK